MMSVRDQIPIYRFLSAVLSMSGSLTIIFIILRSKQKLSSMYRRIIFGLSVADIFQSGGFFFSSFTDLPQFDIPACNIQGFFLHVGFCATPMYNASLCINYVLIVCYQKKKKFLHRLELFLHALNTLWPLGTGIFLVATQHFNYGIGGFCWIVPKPGDCILNSDVECDRGEHAYQYRWIFQGYQTIIIFFGIIISMIMMCVKVFKQERNMERRCSFHSSITSDNVIIDMTEATLELPPNHHNRNRSADTSNGSKKGSKRQVLYQAAFYVLAYFLPTFFPFLFVILTQKGIVNIGLWILSECLLPLQGFFNFLVFIRPRLILIKKQNPDYNWVKCFLITIREASSSNTSTVTVSAIRNTRISTPPPQLQQASGSTIANEDQLAQ